MPAAKDVLALATRVAISCRMVVGAVVMLEVITLPYPTAQPAQDGKNFAAGAKFDIISQRIAHA